MTWETERRPNETCPKCGAVYQVKATHWPSRDPGSIDCACGHRLISWSGSTTFEYKRVPEHQAGDPGRKTGP